eukprot:TRINITY_DN33458_c0_g1_i1.p1 TRINITY_DN33458_c0_g1~~TRINITY_DN33458_c0_g1_i1.p1  ORF type:complete len:428 (+),score=79.42 TRINITY_DN33458_c0_g1_i1:15-1298(+)
MEVPMLLLVLLNPLPLLVEATSIKMDFLSSGVVRTDPLMFSQIGECLSDHVHRFYGAVSLQTMRPDVSYQDLRSASGNTGNVEENKSLYWNPAIYKVNNQNSEKSYKIVDVWFASAYYIFSTGQAKAFPNGLKMRAGDLENLSRVRAVCDGASPCERDDDGGCEGYGPSNQEQHGFLPLSACAELEINIKFPTCWDGINLESKDGEKHVVYSEECDGELHNECFDFDCPASHPVKFPEVHLYVRVLNYEGGAHVFSDGSDIFHSDYFSGWDEKELQYVLDNCENDRDAAHPDAFCSDFLTFRGKPKQEGVQVDDFDIRSDLEKIQPDPIDIKSLISPENVSDIPELLRGACTGTLIAASNTTTISGVLTSECCLEKKVGNTVYQLLRTGSTASYHCLDNCIYQDKKNPGQQFCFMAGDLTSECLKQQ